jgi:ribosome-binding factor A
MGGGALVTHRRNERVSEEIRAVLVEAIREVRDPSVGFVTLTGVDLSPDLKQARVYVSRLGTEAEREAAVSALNHAAAFLRHAVAERARLRYTPALRFVSDATIERGSRLEAIFQKLHTNDDQTPQGDPEDAG